MKKGILTLTISLVLALLTLPLTAFANVFTESPEEFEPAKVVDAVFTGATGTPQLILTPYNHRDTLPPTLHQQIDDAAQGIRGADHVTDLVSGLGTVAKNAGVADPNDLVVSDLFDLHVTGGDWDTVTVKLQSENSSPFVSLLHYSNGGWEIVDQASEKDGIITFTVDDFSPFAVVISTEEIRSPQTGDSFPYGILASALLFGAASVYFLLRGRRSSAV